MKLLSNLEKAMTIQNRYSFNGSIEQLEELILKKNKNQTYIINKGSYKIHSAFSIGTLIIKNSPSVVDSINVHDKLYKSTHSVTYPNKSSVDIVRVGEGCVPCRVPSGNVEV